MFPKKTGGQRDRSLENDKNRKEEDFLEIRDTHTNFDPRNKKGITLCASYTVEAAIVFPIFLCLMVTILLFFRVLQIERGVGSAMNEATRELAVSGKMANVATASILTRTKMKEKNVPAGYIRGGYVGVSFAGSSVSSTEIHLIASYYIKLPTGMFIKNGYLVQQESYVRRWVGWNPSMELGSLETVEYVYITPEGRAYHKSPKCSYLNPTIQTVSVEQLTAKRNYSGHIYYPCPSCHAGESQLSTYYITTYGENYHSKTTCSGLKRTLEMVTVETAIKKGYHACSKCA